MICNGSGAKIGMQYGGFFNCPDPNCHMQWATCSDEPIKVPEHEVQRVPFDPPFNESDD